MENFRLTWKEIWESTQEIMKRDMNDELDFYDYMIMATMLGSTILALLICLSL